MELLQKKKEQGLIRHIGLCNTNIDDFKLASSVGIVSIIQSEFNLFNKDLCNQLKKEIIERNILFWGWGTLDKGIISGRVREDRVFEKHDCRSWAPWWRKSNKDEKIKLMSKVFNSLPNNHHDGVTIALCHAADESIAVLPIIGIKNVKDLNNVFNSLSKVSSYQNLYLNIRENYFD